MKTLILILILIFIFYSCENKNNLLLKNKKIYSNGDSTIYYTSKNGKKNGPIIQYYSSGKIKKKYYFKNNIEDSVFKEYYESGYLKMSTYIINGKEEGIRYDYKDSVEFYNAITFMRHGIPKVIGLSSYDINGNPFIIDYFIYKEENRPYIGSIIFDSIGINKYNSSYYIVGMNSLNNKLLCVPYNKESQIYLVYFHSMSPDNRVIFSIDKSENINKQNDNILIYNIDNKDSLYFDKYLISFNANIKGWHFVTGTIKEFIKGKGNKITPVYFNYYVY